MRNNPFSTIVVKCFPIMLVGFFVLIPLSGASVGGKVFASVPENTLSKEDGYSVGDSREKIAVEIQKFTLYTYRNLIADFATNGGAYVDALLEMCEVPAGYRKDYMHAIKAMMNGYSDKFDFARALSDNYKKTRDCTKG
jgi:hypothetical protein